MKDLTTLNDSKTNVWVVDPKFAKKYNECRDEAMQRFKEDYKRVVHKINDLRQYQMMATRKQWK